MGSDDALFYICDPGGVRPGYTHAGFTLADVRRLAQSRVDSIIDSGVGRVEIQNHDELTPFMELLKENK